MSNKKADASTEVAVVKPSFLATLAPSNLVPEYVNTESNRGNANVNQEDLQIPRIKILQFISDEVKRGTESYIDGAQPGMFINTVTNELSEKLYVINVDYDKRWNLWKTRTAGGGLLASCKTAAEANEALALAAETDGIKLDDTARIEKTYEIVETPEHACLLINPETGETSPAVIDMPSTKQKVSKKWNSVLAGMVGDRWAHVFELEATLETNKRNEDYYNYAFKDIGWASAELVAAGEAFWEGIQNSRR